MLKWTLSLLLFTISSSSLFALEISLNGAKENFKAYSTLHLTDNSRFLCQEEKDDFEVVTQIVCAFVKKPSQEIKKLQNNFFRLESKINKGTFFLIITPIQKIKLYPIVFDLTKENSVYQANVKVSNHWMIVGYEDKLPYIKNKKPLKRGINFPFVMSRDKLPYVGGLDLKGHPVYIKKVQDVTDYLRIKKLYKEKKYELSLELIDDVMLEYPNSLFNPELLFYKIRVFSKLSDNDNIVSTSKVYLREYSSDENVPEVLALTANAYSKIGMNIDADYFFDRLFSEHKESIYTQWGYIYKGEMLEGSGANSKALMFYKKALNETNDIDIAATAAYKLAIYYSSTTKTDTSAEYTMKIINAKANYFINDLKKSMDLMHHFADQSDYITASAIAKALSDEMNINHDEHERLLRDRAMWLSETDEKEEAFKALNIYMKEYPYGLYEEEILVAKDSLFFDLSDNNVSVKLAQYNELISQYMDDTIGNRAVYEKAKLLLKEGMFSDVLGLKDSILELDSQKYDNTQEIIINAATGSMKNYLKLQECQEVLNISHDYNITLSDEWDDGIYKCAMKGGDYQLSKKIANKNLKTKDINERKKWLYRYIKVDFTTGNYSDVLDASKDLILLIEDELSLEENEEYKEVYRYIFDTYQRLESSQKMLVSIINLKEIFGLNYKDIERYVSVMAIGSDLKDDNIVIQYGNDVMSLQNRSSSYVQSPYVEFTLYQAYVNQEDFNRALDVVKLLESIELSSAHRSRQKYLLGSVYSKLWRDEESREAYQQSIDADSTTPWAKLAKSALEI
ncbi:MAG: flagellar protein [Epsilonproteobacteria bacterium]|nr:MAG: flagellar protein [Campylobacterota bacterium]